MLKNKSFNNFTFNLDFQKYYLIILIILFSGSIAYGQYNPNGWKMIRIEHNNQIQNKNLNNSSVQDTHNPKTNQEIHLLVNLLARGLMKNPKLIYEYVQNNIRFVPMFGSINAAETTLLNGSGNDYDQTTLFIDLMRSSGYENINYTHGYICYNPEDIMNWFGADSEDDMNQIINNGGYDRLDYGNYICIKRVWATATIDNVNFQFDPSYKQHINNAMSEYLSDENFLQNIGYSRTNFFNSIALSADENSVNGINNNVHALLNLYTSNFIDWIKTNIPNAGYNELIGNYIIKPESLPDNQYPGAPSNAVFISDDIEKTQNIKSEDCHKLSILYNGINYSFNINDISGKRVSIFHNTENNNKPELKIDGILSVSGSGQNAIGNSTTKDQYYKMTLTVHHPNNDDYKSEYNLKSPYSYCLVFDFGGNVSIDLITYRNKILSKHLQSNDKGESEDVLGETLNIIGLNWLYQVNLSEKLTAQLSKDKIIRHHWVGVVAQEDSGYYIDIKSGLYSTLKDESFLCLNGIHSALEHGILEQLQGEDHPAVSAIKVLAQSNKIFYIDKNNIDNIIPLLTGYSTNQIDIFRSYIENNEAESSIILPENGNVKINEWEGFAYIHTFNKVSGGKVINGQEYIIDQNHETLHGGYSTLEEDINTEKLSNELNTNFSPSIEEHTVPVKDPVDIATGSYLYQHKDLSIGRNEELLGLTFSRFYNSRNNFRKRNMGYGWSHGYDIYIERHSDGASVLNGRLPIDAASSIIGIKIVLDLFKHVQTEISRPDMMRSQVAAILTHKWIADQLINNSITIHMGSSSLKYIKLPDESYNPPPNTTASLIYNSETNSYQLKDRFDKKYQFNSGDKIEYVLDSDGRKLIFNYENEKLKRVNNKIPDLTGQLYFDLSYDDNELLRSIEDNTDRIIHFEYKGDEMVSYTNAEKKHWRFKYDSNHQLLIIQDPEGYTQTDNTYDDSGRVISQKNANNQTYNFYYSKYKNTEEDPENNQTIYSFDNNRHLICTENAYGHRTKRKYDGQGHLTELCNPRKFTTTYIYDHYNNLRFVVDATNKQSEYIYDDFHRLAFFTNRSGHTTEYKYDTKHRLITTIDPEGNYYTKNYYQENGLLKATIDANNNKTTYYYDEYGFIDIVKMESADGFLQTAYDYDYNIRGYFEYLYEINPKLLKGKTIISPGKNQIKELIDYQRRYKFEYDKRKLLLKEFNPLNNDDTPKTKYLYDDNGNIRERHEFNIETGQYDITEYRHTPTNKIESIDYPDNTTVTIKYDSRDNIDYIIDPTGKNDYTYDKINRLKIFTRLFTIYYIYDEDGYTGQLTSIVYPGGFIGNKVKYTYDSLNRMKTITDWKNNLTEYHYDEIENEKDIKRTIYPNKSKMKYIYDKAGRLMALQNKKQDNSVIADYNYKFDSVGNIESVSYTDTIQFNFKSKTDFFKHNIANQIENSGFIYNIQGDIVNGLGYDFNYDHSHKLSTVSYSGHTSKYTYDGLGNRIKVEQDSVVKQYILNPETSVILAETSQGNIDRYYVYGDGLLYSIDIKGDTFFYHYDATGNTVAMTDKDSKIVNRYAYSPFGMEFFKDETVSNSFKFVGREGVIDDANGLYYMKARYYIPKLGRFISSDPIGHNGGMNLYAYVGNNPINYIDPDGLINPIGWIVKLTSSGMKKLSSLGSKKAAEQARRQGHNVLTTSRQQAKAIEKAAHGTQDLMKHKGHSLPGGKKGRPHFQTDGKYGHTFWGSMVLSLFDPLDVISGELSSDDMIQLENYQK